MKTKKMALAAIAVLMVFALTGCIGKFIPVVVTINGQEVSSGMYLLMQLNAYNEAMGLAEEAGEKLETPEDLFNATIEDKKAQKWIEDKTLELCKDYVAVVEYAQQEGIALTKEDIKTIDTQMASWDSFKASYEANGIGQKTVRAYYEYATLANSLFLKLYGKDGQLAPSKDQLASLYSEKYSNVRFMVVNLADQNSAEGEYSATADEARIAVKNLVQQLNKGEVTINQAAYAQLAALNAIANPPESGQPPEAAEVELDDDGEEIISPNLYTQYLSHQPDTQGLYVEEFLTRLKGEATGSFGYYESELAKAMIIYEKLPIFETEKSYDEMRENLVQELMQDEFKDYMRETSSGYTVKWVFGAKWYYSPKNVVVGQSQQ